MADDLSIIIDNTSLSGWEDIHLVRSCERVPSAFDITATEKYPGQFRDVWIEAGKPCTVKIGSDTVLTGYVDRVVRDLSPQAHTVRVQGRSKVEDVVDCTVTDDVLSGMMVRVADLVTLAQRICSPFGIKVKAIGDLQFPILAGQRQTLAFAASLGQRAFEVIEEAARYSGVMVYDDQDGDLVLSTVGSATMASGFAQGVNVQAAYGTLSMDQRYSKYIPHLMSFNAFANGVGSGNLAFPPVLDTGVPRFRPLNVISEQFQQGQSLAQERAKWEMQRRYGRSQEIRLICDSWRDSAGTLWQPNAYAQVYLPALKCAPQDPWVISDVTYHRDGQRGTTAELLLYPKQAFAVEPNFLMPFAWGTDSGPTKGAANTGPTPGAGHGDLG